MIAGRRRCAIRRAPGSPRGSLTKRMPRRMPPRSNSPERMVGCAAARVPVRPSGTGAGAAVPWRHGVVEGLADICAFVVETGVALVQAVLFGPALAEFRPVEQALARRAAIAAAGKLAIALRAHRLRLEAEPQAANFALV